MATRVAAVIVYTELSHDTFASPYCALGLTTTTSSMGFGFMFLPVGHSEPVNALERRGDAEFFLFR